MSYPASIKRLKGQGIIRKAAMHNFREIAAEIGPYGSIDPTRINQNYTVRGPESSDAVAARRNSLLKNAGIKKLKSNAVEGLEVLFTWPHRDRECPPQYFEDCTQWAADHFQVPVLSSVVHLDESTPHCHVLLLPLVNGHMNGSALFGTGLRLGMHLNAFYRIVGEKYGFVRKPPEPKLSASVRNYLIQKAQMMLNAISGLTEETVEIILAPHRRNPLRLAEHLKIGLPVEAKRQQSKFVEMMTRPAG